jgi:hypothetical protein
MEGGPNLTIKVGQTGLSKAAGLVMLHVTFLLAVMTPGKVKP